MPRARSLMSSEPKKNMVANTMNPLHELTQTREMQFDFQSVQFPFEIESSETIISSTVELTGSWESNQLCLYIELIGDSGVFVDIGANIGINSIFASKVGTNSRVLAIEASPVNFAILTRNIARNCDARVAAAHMAIADHDGRLSFVGSGTNAHIDLQSEAAATTVDCRTLDSLYAARSLSHVDLIKIDVEGYTDLVLSHADNALKVTRHAIIEFSYNDVVTRLRGSKNLAPSHREVLGHCDMLFDLLRRSFTHFYYISRHAGLVRLDDPRELFKLMIDGPSVGDVLCSRGAMVGAMSATAFGFDMLANLMHENHLRIVEIQRLQAALAAFEH